MSIACLVRRSAVPALVIFTAINAQTATAATLTRIPTLGGNAVQSSSSAVNIAINSAGTVVGGSQLSNGDTHGFSYTITTGTLTDLGLASNSPARAYGTAYGINASGTIVGGIQAPTYSYKAYNYSGGSYTVLNQLATATGSTAYGINSAGVTVGTVNYVDSTTNKSVGQAFAYVNNTMYNLGSLGSGSSSAASINDSNVIVGNSGTATGASRGFSYVLTTDSSGVPNGTMTAIPMLTGGSANAANAINNNGDIVGWSYNASTTRHAYLLTAGSSTPVDLDPTSVRAEAFGLNNVGDVVGYDYFQGGTSLATLWRGGQTIDLNALYHATDPNALSTITLTQAYGINDAGQIVGIGTDGSTSFNFVLTVPEPASMGVLGLAAAGLLRRRRA